MKKKVQILSVVLIGAVTMTSCHTYTTVVGNGPQTGLTVKKHNHYLVGGLVPVSVSDAKKAANGKNDYSVTTEQSFVDGLLRVITLGLYAPSTTIVTM